jgi:hypothetical protein
MPDRGPQVSQIRGYVNESGLGAALLKGPLASGFAG